MIIKRYKTLDSYKRQLRQLIKYMIDYINDNNKDVYLYADIYEHRYHIKMLMAIRNIRIFMSIKTNFHLIEFEFFDVETLEMKTTSISISTDDKAFSEETKYKKDQIKMAYKTTLLVIRLIGNLYKFNHIYYIILYINKLKILTNTK